MKKTYLFLLATIVLALVACTPTNNSTPQELTGIGLNKKTIEIKVGDTYQLRVWYEPEEAEDGAPEVEWNSSKSRVASVSDNGRVEAKSIGKTTITATCGKFQAECNVEVVYPEMEVEFPKEGFIEGKFSVSSSTEVYFSKGNLRYNAYSKIWRFAEKQYEFVGEGNNNISSSYNGWIDLFGWGTGDNPTKTSSDANDFTTFHDWGDNKIQNGGNTPKQWRTLSNDEWKYLILDRSNAENLFALGTVNGISGLILLPDDWSTPKDVSFTPSITQGMSRLGDLGYNGENYVSNKINGYLHNTYSTSEWNKMEEAGAVFLPAAGNNNYWKNPEASYAYDYGGYGLYLSSYMHSSLGACCLNIDYSDITVYYKNINNRFSVRLVVDIK